MGGIRFRLKKPRFTVGTPRVTVEPPRVTIGGDVGRISAKVTRAVRDAVAAPVAPAVQVIEVVKGKPVDQAFQDAIKAQIQPATSTAEAVADADASMQAMMLKLTEKLAGEAAVNLTADIMRVARPVPPDQAAALVRSVQLFVETFDIKALNPLSILVAGEIVHTRNLYWNNAHALPADVIAAVPEELRGRAGECRYLTVAAMGSLTLPSIAIRHLNRASAVCLVDLLVFDTVPGSATDNDKHYWTHELVHASQYATWGVQEFVARYVANEFSGGLNRIEEDADRYACSHFPQAQPHYLENCTV